MMIIFDRVALTLLAFLTWMVSSPSSMRRPSGVFMAEGISWLWKGPIMARI